MINTLTNRSGELVEAFEQGFGPLRGHAFSVSMSAEPSWLEFRQAFHPYPIVTTGEDDAVIFDSLVKPAVRQFANELSQRSTLKYRVPELMDVSVDDHEFHQIIIDAAPVAFRVIVRRGLLWAGAYQYNEDADPTRIWDIDFDTYTHAEKLENGVDVIVDAYVKPELELDPTDFPADERDLVTSAW